MAEATQERDKRQDEIRGNTFETAVAMKGMLDAMAAEAERVKAQSKTDNWRCWVIAAITVLTLLTAAIPAIPLIVSPFPQCQKAQHLLAAGAPVTFFLALS